MSAAFITLTFYIFLLRERRGAARMGSSTKWAGVWGAAPVPLASSPPAPANERLTGVSNNEIL